MMRRAFIVLVVVVVSLAFALPAFAEKLTVWAIDMPDDQPDHAYAKALVEGFKAKNSDIELDYVPLGVDPLKDRVKIAMAAGSGMPDVFQSWGGSTLASYAEAGRLLDLTAELKGLPGSAAAQTAMSAKGKIYGVAPFFAIAGLFINEGIFKDNGLKVPTTVDELNTVAAALKAKGIQPFACGARDKWPLLAMYMYLTNRYGGEDLFTKAAARKARFDDPGFVKAAQAYQDMLKKGYFGDQPLGEAYGDAQQLMASGKAAMQVSGTWLCANYASKDYTDQSFGFYAFPIVKGGKGKATDLMGMTDIGYAASIAGKAKKALVVRFMKYAMSPDAAQAEPGRICSVPGVKARNPLTGQASALFGTGKTVQFWWDQNLPAAVTTPLNDTIQSFALPDTDVKAALTKFEALATENMGKVK